MDKNNANYSEGLSRRNFLKGSAGVMAVAAMGGGLATRSYSVLATNTSAEATSGTEYINGFCDGCLYKKCMTKYKVKDGVLLSADGHPDGIFNEGNLCVRGQAQVMNLYNPWRAKTPLKRTNPKKGLDVDPGWVEISWEEAMDTTTKKINEVMENDPHEFVMFSGFGAYQSLYMRAFTTAIGSPNVIYAPGSFCSVHSGSEILHGSFFEMPDPKHCKYRIDIGKGGTNVGSADGETQGDVEGAIDRGVRTVKVDPRNSTLFSNSEWVPIKPQTELAFVLSLEYVILHEIKVIDEWFVKNRTNATYLIGEDGFYVRHAESNKPLVWDVESGTAKEFDDSSIGDYALEGSFQVNGVTTKPSFSLIKEKVKEYTPEWQEGITTIPAVKIRELANDLVKEARIGSTIDINGVTFPYRPACVTINKGLTNHQWGHLAYYTAMTVNILLGAFDVPGGDMGLTNYSYAKDEDGHPLHFHMGPPHHISFPPNTLDMKALIPMQHDIGYIYSHTAKDTKGYWLDYTPKVGMFYGGNLFSKGGSIEEISEGLAALEFAVEIAIHIDEHAHFADIILPEANHFETDFCYEREFERPYKQEYKLGPMSARKALVKPLYDGRSADEILMELAGRLNIMPKTNGIMSAMNNIKGVAPTTTNLTDVWNVWIKGKYGDEWDFDKVAEVGQISLPPIPEHETYQYYHAPEDQVRLPIYHIFLKKTGVEMLEFLEKAGVEHPSGNDTIREIYQPIPHWFESNEFPHGEDGFDMNLVGWRSSQFMHDVNNSTGNPILQEVALKSPLYGKLVLNPETAKKKDLKDGDMVYVENQHGVKVGPVPVKTSEIIHPDAAGVEAGHSRKAFSMNPVNHTSPLSWNRLASISWKSIDPVTGAIEISPMIRITKA